MSEFDAEQLDKACRKVNECELTGVAIPSQLQPAYLAAKYNVTVQEVLNRCQELKAT